MSTYTSCIISYSTEVAKEKNRCHFCSRLGMLISCLQQGLNGDHSLIWQQLTKILAHLLENRLLLQMASLQGIRCQLLDSTPPYSVLCKYFWAPSPSTMLVLSVPADNPLLQIQSFILPPPTSSKTARLRFKHDCQRQIHGQKCQQQKMKRLRRKQEEKQLSTEYSQYQASCPEGKISKS